MLGWAEIMMVSGATSGCRMSATLRMSLLRKCERTSFTVRPADGWPLAIIVELRSVAVNSVVCAEGQVLTGGS